MTVLEFNCTDADRQSYSNFITELRDALTGGRREVHGIPVLRRAQDVPATERFLFVDLTNYDDQTIRVVIDVVDAYVVGYRTGEEHLYYFQDNRTVAQGAAPVHTLFGDFPDNAHNLGFPGSYRRLAGVAEGSGSRSTDDRPMLQQIGLGRNELSNAIGQLHDAPARFARAARARDPAEARRLRSQAPQARGLLVIIQMLSEAARFRYIENRVGEAMGEDNRPFHPDTLTRDMETHWSDLSEEIQRVRDPTPVNGGGFRRHFVLGTTGRGEHRVEVNSIQSTLVQNRGIRMMLYDTDPANCNPEGTVRVRIPGRGPQPGPSRRRDPHDEQ